MTLQFQQERKRMTLSEHETGQVDDVRGEKGSSHSPVTIALLATKNKIHIRL
jgi:hypothetical protein